ncbi:MAG: RnfABCDGE type electron transport complex subunit G [Clostridiales bacterium]|nr:RnfABCDGE type electron transport complex subunit G [Clostridiales bacterium]
MKEIVKLALILFIISSIAAGLLGFTYDFTIDQITEQRKIADEVARKEVFKDADSFEKFDDNKLSELQKINPAIAEGYFAKKDENIIGYVFKTKPSGFSGIVEVVTGITIDGIITGLRIGNHQETPGLGANATLPKFYSQYKGLTVKETINVTKTVPSDNEILAISGATITSRGVTDGVNFINEIFDILND